MFLQKYKELNANLGGLTKIYVASTNIASREIITPEQVTTMEIPNKFVTDSHIVNPEDITNKVSVVPLSQGDMITKNLLKNVSNVANENNRLITLFRNEKVSFDQELENLDRVDIIVSHQFEGKPTTKIFMSDVTVANVSKSENEFRGVRLEVSKEQAPELIHMQNYADSIRVLKANVGKQKQGAQIEEKETEKSADNPKEEKPAEQKTEKPAPQQGEKPAETPVQNQQGTPAEKPAEQKPPGQG